MDSIVLERINQHRSTDQWESAETEVRALLETDPNDFDALRILAQSIEKLGREKELPAIWAQLVDLEEAPGATAKRLASALQEAGDEDGAVTYYRRAMESFLKTKNYDQIENVWLELVTLAPEPLAPYLPVLDGLVERGRGKRAGLLAQMLWPYYMDAERWTEALRLAEVAALHAPEDDSTRSALITCLEGVHSECPDLENILASTGLRRDRELDEGYTEVRRLIPFASGSAFRHPDWGVGIVKRLDVFDKKATIDFQRRKGQVMAIDLAERALEFLADDDYRTIRVKTPDRARELVEEDALFLARSVIKSFGGPATTRQIKERICGDIVEVRAWNRWWTSTQSLLKDDPYVAVTGGAAKTYALRDEPATEEQEWLRRLERVKNIHGKLDVIRKYLQHVKSDDRDADLLSEMAGRVVGAAQKQRKPEIIVEVVYTVEDLASACTGFAADPGALAVEPFASEPHSAVKTIQALRFSEHQSRFATKIQETEEQAWPEIFQRLLLSPTIQVRDQLAESLHEASHHDRLAEVLRVVSREPRQYVDTYSWLSDRTLGKRADYLLMDIAPGVLCDRLLQLIDFLADQAKRLEKEDADRLRKQAAGIRAILKSGHYRVFHDILPTLDRGQAISVYRRAAANAGLDVRAREHFTSRILALYPDLFSEGEVDAGPPMLLCLSETLHEKRLLLERLSSVDIPQVTREMELARQQGDLKENAEYHAARDRIRLLSAQASELQDQLAMARAVPTKEVNSNRVGFGTKVTLRTRGGDFCEIYYFLGPWESDPDRKVLSINAPFASKFVGRVVGDDVDVELSTHTGRYTVEAVESFDPASIPDAPPPAVVSDVTVEAHE